MGKPAARQSDNHVCPDVCPGPVPHVGGPILPPCESTVLIGNLPAARVSDKAACACATDSVTGGSATVLIGGEKAARAGDDCAHGGVIVGGMATVLIGDARGGAMVEAAKEGKPFCEDCELLAALQGDGPLGGP